MLSFGTHGHVASNKQMAVKANYTGKDVSQNIFCDLKEDLDICLK